MKGAIGGTNTPHVIFSTFFVHPAAIVLWYRENISTSGPKGLLRVMHNERYAPTILASGCRPWRRKGGAVPQEAATVALCHCVVLLRGRRYASRSWSFACCHKPSSSSVERSATLFPCAHAAPSIKPQRRRNFAQVARRAFSAST